MYIYYTDELSSKLLAIILVEIMYICKQFMSDPLYQRLLADYLLDILWELCLYLSIKVKNGELQRNYV